MAHHAARCGQYQCFNNCPVKESALNSYPLAYALKQEPVPKRYGLRGQQQAMGWLHVLACEQWVICNDSLGRLLLLHILDASR